jgi:hypothetical protein
MTRNSIGAIAASIAVVIVVTLGFRNLGSPATERLIQQDRRTVQSLASLARQINFNWAQSNKVLPANLDRFRVTTTQDLTTHQPFIYHPKGNSQYELCATFVLDNQNANPQNGDAFWAHPKGEYCFQFDASLPAPQAPFAYY